MGLGREATQRRPPRRGGLSSGLAAALDEYEHAPHGAIDGRTSLLRGEPDSARCSPSETAVPSWETRPGEPPARPPRGREPRVRRLPSGRLRLVLPQRDRPAARDAGRDPRRDDGRVRHRLRRRYGVAAVRRTRREGAHRHRRARPQARRGGRRDLPRRRPGRGARRRLVDAARPRPLLAALPRRRRADRGHRRRDRRPGRGRRHRGARRLHALRALAADHLRPGRHAARALAHRRAVHRRRGDGGARTPPRSSPPNVDPRSARTCSARSQRSSSLLARSLALAPLVSPDDRARRARTRG